MLAVPDEVCEALSRVPDIIMSAASFVARANCDAVAKHASLQRFVPTKKPDRDLCSAIIPCSDFAARAYCAEVVRVPPTLAPGTSHPSASLLLAAEGPSIAPPTAVRLCTRLGGEIAWTERIHSIPKSPPLDHRSHQIAGRRHLERLLVRRHLEPHGGHRADDLSALHQAIG